MICARCWTNSKSTMRGFMQPSWQFISPPRKSHHDRCCRLIVKVQVRRTVVGNYHNSVVSQSCRPLQSTTSVARPWPRVSSAVGSLLTRGLGRGIQVRRAVYHRAREGSVQMPALMPSMSAALISRCLGAHKTPNQTYHEKSKLATKKSFGRATYELVAH